MKALIIVSCLLGSGKDWNPRGHYKSWKQCENNIRKFERRLVLKKRTLCWCHRKDYAYPYLVKPPLPRRTDVDKN
jgi:hypothetical protein